jgi:dehydrogenase/reductase SDR family member 7B
MDHKNKTIWITGASSGIGKSLVKKFYAQGANIILSSRNQSGLEQVAKEFKLNQDRFKILSLDLEQLAQLKEKTIQALALFNGIDIVIHNGGISQRSFAKDTEFSVDERLMKVNFLSYVAITKAILPHMLTKGKGQFIVISSLVGKFGTPLRSSYSATKHALHGFFDSLRAELHQQNIKVLIVCPGFIKTNVSLNAMVGNGSSQGLMDQAQENGMSSELFSDKLLLALRKEKEEVYIGGKETIGVFIKRHFPAIFSKLIRKAQVT